jgi:hypothetical protein
LQPRELREANPTDTNPKEGPGQIMTTVRFQLMYDTTRSLLVSKEAVLLLI